MSTTTQEPERTEATSPGGARIGRRLLVLAGAALLIGLLVFSLPGLGEVRSAFSDVSPGWLVLVAALELCSCTAYVLALRPTFSSSLPWGLAARIGFAEQGTNVLVPTGGAGGLALGAWALKRAGMSAKRIARRSVSFFVLTSGANFSTAILFGVALSVGLLRTDRGLGYTLGPAVAAALVLGLVVLLGRTLPHQDEVEELDEDAGRLQKVAKLGGGALGDGFRDAGLLLRRHPPALIAGAVGYMAFDAAALWTAFVALGQTPEASTFMLAYVLGQLGGLIPIPGGLGGTDGGLVGALVLFGSPVAVATAAVLGYRLFQLMIPAVLGTISLIALRRDAGALRE